MIKLFKSFHAKITALLLVLLLFCGELSLLPQDQEKQRENALQLAAANYQKELYWEVVRDLELVLTDMDENPLGSKQFNKLKGNVYLLLGASCEQLGQAKKAEEYYQAAKALLYPGDLMIRGISFSKLKIYQSIFKDKEISTVKKKGVITRPVLKRKKRRLSTLMLVQIVAVVAGITAALLIKKKKDPINIYYDTAVVGIVWDYVWAGEFSMGDNYNEGEADEQPVHTVNLGNYNISKYEITFYQYDKFCKDTTREYPDDNGWGRGNRPVVNITWNDANAFCEWLSQKSGKIIKLPTEAQWEKAARGTDQRRYPWGNEEPTCELVNYNCETKTTPAGYYKDSISAYELRDMAGNVSEWCRDQYDANFYSISPYNNPVNLPANANDSVLRVIRGGSWDSSQRLTIRCADRDYVPGGEKRNDIGFRIIRELD